MQLPVGEYYGGCVFTVYTASCVVNTASWLDESESLTSNRDASVRNNRRSMDHVRMMYYIEYSNFICLTLTFIYDVGISMGGCISHYICLLKGVRFT